MKNVSLRLIGNIKMQCKVITIKRIKNLDVTEFTFKLLKTDIRRK